MNNESNRTYEIFLFCLYILVWAWSWWRPANMENWFLENKILFFMLPLILVVLWRIKLSKLSLSAIVFFMILHVIGAHYNYGYVPFGSILSDVFGLSSNVYDKFVHFSFGFLITYPILELLTRAPNMPTKLNYFFSFCIIMACSAIYEIIEWINVIGIDPHIAYLFIGGNDPFDTAKDMLMAGLGALFTLFLVSSIRSRRPD